MVYKGILVGLFGGLLVSLYRLGIEFGTEKALHAYGILRQQPLYILPWLGLIGLVSYLVYRLIKLEPYAKGSGIPQVEGIVLLGMKMKWYTILVVRFAAGLLTALFGVSLGREGPSIQVGAAGAQAVSKLTGKNKVEENYLITSGAAAGLAAAFNAPLSGIMFTLEEVHRSFSPHILIAATTAALTADMVSKMIFGLSPALNYGAIPQLPLRYYALLPLVGIVSGVVGAVFNKGLLRFGKLYEKLPALARPALALLFALLCGLFLPEVLGGGQNLIRLSEAGQGSLTVLALFLGAKLLFTCICFGSGIPGGIFMPILAAGALSGGIAAKFAMMIGLPGEYVIVFCVCAMAGALSGSVKAPLTSILLMTEMTGSLVQLLPVAIVAFAALLTSDLLGVSPIYEVLLERIAPQEDGVAHAPTKSTLLEMPVELGSVVAGNRVREIHWPQGMLIVGLRRGEKEFVPNGETQIMHGDYLVALSSDRQYEQMRRILSGLCRGD